MQTKRGKYMPLFRHLMEFDAERWLASFTEVETVLGFALPRSARRHAAWWANEHNGTHSHARAWQAAGWRTNAVDLRAQTLAFERQGPCGSRPAKRGEGQRRRASVGRNCPLVEGTETAVNTSATTGTLTLDGQTFRHAARISPEAGPGGKPLEHMPQPRYHAADSTPLNRHGHGPFCRFSVAGLPAAPGLYAVTVAQELVYVGIAKESLQERWGPKGYAQIHPRNCFKGGQSTNCKVNHAILLAARKGLAVDLWMQLAEQPRPLEGRLIAKFAPPWNDQR